MIRAPPAGRNETAEEIDEPGLRADDRNPGGPQVGPPDAVTTPTVRPCEPGDCDAVVDIWRRSEASGRVTDTAEHVLRLVGEHPGALLVAVVDGVVAGTIIAAWDGWRGNIYRLAVLAEYRRRGIARALVAEAERRLEVLGVTRVTALVEHEHPWAVAFWNASRFRLDPTMVRFVRDL
jgi:ribosomal protein S18 acetylase RimI-like enzyme